MHAAISDMANSASAGTINGDVKTSGDLSEKPRKFNHSTHEIKYFSPQSNHAAPMIDFSQINSYADLRHTNTAFRDGIAHQPSDNSGQYTYNFSGDNFSKESGSYDYRILRTGSHAIDRVYQKDEKVDHHLFGSQFYKVAEDEARNPFNFESYQDFSYQSKLLAKGFSQGRP